MRMTFNRMPEGLGLLIANIGIFISIFDFNPGKTDLRTLLNESGRQSQEYAVNCQRNLIMSQFRGNNLYLVNKGFVFIGKECSGSAKGVSSWEQLAKINSEYTEQCWNLTGPSGYRRLQWSIRDRNLVLIEKNENCSTEFMRNDYGIRIRETAYPIYWHCQKAYGYNPDNLDKECLENRRY